MNSKSKLSRVTSSTAHRSALRRNMLTSLILNEHIKTTEAKAKTLVSTFDKVFNYAVKLDENNAKKYLAGVLYKDEAITKLLKVLKERYKGQNGGFVQTFRVGNRKGDNAPMIKLILKGYSYKGIGETVTKVDAKKKATKVEKASSKKK